ncbi:4-hydroxythreonine-4-phosphate dehydrogenase [Rhodoferax ferrireducens]|uniref:4-hydroxythreonine-4-phosphate dehydrogenase n=1 Tax=Rhodoferax ferrireducens TaxID=192843 RepID=A0ABU2C5G0_9BURK|nr:4-hydroxythreonine-4-phosphate dehydrogenase PdxA [Rhodoferax ferrireducens]MDR7376519.1 4-hydroxythreonine-4-phosphate dehydrogenase [Rhodoferax ferrireducens]
MSKPIRLALTMGDPAGIGPEIIVKAAHQMRDLVQQGRVELQVFGCGAALQRATQLLQLDAAPLHMVDVGPVDGPMPVGQVSAAAGKWSYLAVERAVQRTQAGEIDAIVTAPLCKEALHLAGYPFEGHTEMLAHLTGMRDGVMMLAHGGMRVSHVSTHCPLSEVPKRLTPVRLRRVLDVTLNALRALGIENPRIAVAGLNPHAGEGGILGKEDGEIIAPIVAEYAAAGHAVTGPWAGDTVFIKLRAGQFDAVVAMFHDQGHIPVKLLGFSIDPATGAWNAVSGVNITLGLPILRTSVDHGTAFDIAGKGIASADSMVDAAQYAMTLVEGLRRTQPQPLETLA